MVEAEVIHKVEAEGTGDVVQLKMQTKIIHLCFVVLLNFGVDTHWMVKTFKRCWEMFSHEG